ncbi:SDR family oxidoreductase [Epibacterium sp. Ofav1-8]|uniref:SDR family oxidoreductase n=1 Tax=Epibacterium sp. Ofav1-8 TaxID=2917735 RepID=UPI001EF4FC52|nr:SDR family oxidoreductase [Epibacterium sp. Ofav1-8]MCG7623813.1 SDR family oxidoreductase [Epibacterium sp. Ofav1-8]
MSQQRRALVLGAYGLIGAACVRALDNAGFEVVGMGRSAASAQAANLPVQWEICDITTLTVAQWQEMLRDVDVVVNAAGALQDGARDNLEAIHVTAIANLTEAIGDLPVRLVQISAAGVSETAPTAFFRSKARGDALVSDRLSDWVILRPTLVLAREAYGGTALLRAIASIPLVQPQVLADAPVQTVALDDVAEAVVRAATGDIPARTTATLTEAGVQSFSELTSQVRAWLGLPPARWRPVVPGWMIRLSSCGADLLGHLGWRSPLRRSALRSLEAGIRGDPGSWIAAGGGPCRSLADTLKAQPATRQDRMFARVYLLLPLAIATLSLFWILSGIIPFFDYAGTVSILTERGAAPWASTLAVIGGAVLDIVLGAAVLWRPWVRRAALGMVALSLSYLLGSVVAAPDLWLDPVGPMIKVFPGMVLAGFVWLVVEAR